MKKLKIVQVGVGHEHARGKMHTARTCMSDVYEIAGIAAETPDAETKNRDHECYANLQSMDIDDIFRIPDLDALFIETDMRLLVATTKLGLDHHLPMHLDKPGGGEELEAFAELMHEAEKKGVFIQLGYMLRDSHAVKFLKKAVCLGWLGDIFEFDANMHRYDGNWEYRDYLSSYKGGGMFHLGSHDKTKAFQASIQARINSKKAG